MSLNLCIFIGNLTRDPEMRHTASGKKVANFGIAINGRPFKDKVSGEQRKEVLFLDCEAWDRDAENIEQYFQKGTPICVRGSLKQDNWQDKDGNKRSKAVLRVERWEFVGSGNKQAPVGAGNDTDFVGGNADGESDIPF